MVARIVFRVLRSVSHVPSLIAVAALRPFLWNANPSLLDVFCFFWTTSN